VVFIGGNMTTIEVIDSAVKVGLGALLTAGGTIIKTFIDNSHESRKARNLRYYEKIEQASDLIDNTTYVSLKYWAIIYEWIINSRRGNDLSLEQKNELKSIQNELSDAFKDLTTAESKMRLLGVEECAKQIRQYGEFLIKFHQEYYCGNSMLTDLMMDEIRNKILILKDDLLKKLATNYIK
jgi:hypothetical protein